MNGSANTMKRALLIAVVGLLGVVASYFAWPPIIQRWAPRDGDPRHLADCFRELDRRLSSEDKEKLRSGKVQPGQLHFGMGRGLRNQWLLSRNSRLAAYFDRLGIHHADDMSGIIIESYVRYLRGDPIRLEEQIAVYKHWWERALPPKEGSPKDGAKIAWIRGNDIGSDNATHLGISVSDESCWRYQFGKGIAPASESESAELSAWLAERKKDSRFKLSDLVRWRE